MNQTSLSYPFLNPVDPKALSLKNYEKIVKVIIGHSCKNHCVVISHIYINCTFKKKSPFFGWRYNSNF